MVTSLKGNSGFSGSVGVLGLLGSEGPMGTTTSSFSVRVTFWAISFWLPPSSRVVTVATVVLGAVLAS